MKHCEFRVSNCEMETTQFAITNPQFAMFVRLEGFPARPTQKTHVRAVGRARPTG